ncbi:MAG: hypothetical protein ACLSF2_04215 [Butyricicoccus sp.]
MSFAFSLSSSALVFGITGFGSFALSASISSAVVYHLASLQFVPHNAILCVQQLIKVVRLCKVQTVAGCAFLDQYPVRQVSRERVLPLNAGNASLCVIST